MISKSTFVKYYKCPRLLWCYYNKIESEMTSMARLNISNGNKVGELAKSYFAGTVDCSVKHADGIDYDEQVKKTQQTLKSGANAIAEASFKYEDLFCAVDILKKEDDGYSIYEVKSVVKLEDYHKVDIAFQKYILEKCGLKIKHIYLMHINNEYVFHNSLDVKQYFKVEIMDTDTVVVDALDEINNNKALLNNIEKIRMITSAKSEEPKNTFCKYCKDCEYSKHCFKDFPKDCIGELCKYGAEKAGELYNEGYYTIEDFLKTDNYKKDNSKKEKDKGVTIKRRQIQIDLVTKKINNPYIDKDKLVKFICSVKYPIYHLDFETTKLIIPEFEGFTPNEEYPYQYSLHIEHENGLIEHKEFLGSQPNCVREFAQSLVNDIPMDSTIMVFNQNMEKNKMVYLANKFDDLKDHLNNLADNIVDLFKVFDQFFYYNYYQHGSCSIKDVMPVLCIEHKDDYSNLPKIKHGDDAISAYWTLLELTGQEKEDMKSGMLSYCSLDTMSMVWVFRKLKELI